MALKKHAFETNRVNSMVIIQHSWRKHYSYAFSAKSFNVYSAKCFIVYSDNIQQRALCICL